MFRYTFSAGDYQGAVKRAPPKRRGLANSDPKKLVNFVGVPCPQTEQSFKR